MTKRDDEARRNRLFRFSGKIRVAAKAALDFALCVCEGIKDLVVWSDGEKNRPPEVEEEKNEKTQNGSPPLLLESEIDPAPSLRLPFPESTLSEEESRDNESSQNEESPLPQEPQTVAVCLESALPPPEERSFPEKESEENEEPKKEHSPLQESENNPKGIVRDDCSLLPESETQLHKGLSRQPGKRGSTDKPTPPPRPRSPKRLYPELVCKWGGEKGWVVAVSLPPKTSCGEIRQGDKILGDDRVLVRLDCDVEVDFDGDKTETVKLSGGLLIFRARQNWPKSRECGRATLVANGGYYIVFAPASCGKRLGNPPVGQPRCDYPNFGAHYFVGGDASDDFENYRFSRTETQFSLEGNIVCDDSADMGELFVGGIPRLKDKHGWRDISQVAVGEEGGGRWLGNFDPREKQIADILQNGASGWFFVRIYDDDGQLLRSMHFRHSKGLREIRVDGKSDDWRGFVFAPLSGGYKPARVEFVGETEATQTANPRIREKAQNNFEIDPHPCADSSRYVLQDDSGSVEVAVALPRVWWKLANADNWRATPETIDRKRFRQAYDEILRIRLPRFAKTIRAGFADLGKPRFGFLDVDEYRQIDLPLAYFADYPEADKSFGRQAMLSVDVNGQDKPFVVLCIPADAPSVSPTKVKSAGESVVKIEPKTATEIKGKTATKSPTPTTVTPPKNGPKPRGQKIRVRLQAFDCWLLDKSAQEIVLAAGRAGSWVVGPVPLPVRKRRYDLLRSPHKDKTSREKIELREHIRIIDIVDLTSKTSDELMRLDLPPGVHANVKVLN